ncbi:alpha-amylase family glycosyl hydrolase [Parasphaerochaeta coccoides]|uniref:Alpha amylase catalytic region n=1 Tax=Parasphaerochaeta coccoides (strain ATCC BAA-1237 / DSM 17374 / SPN1) TaxID=760011 RepID=F4GLY6_PARC1|nr:alpha-amylase family glycosyl hydrolase [Parasphaerochaeta coccoides]AEC03027.1 alpha amylase catalytic region [Parasphaerochaeta coccoides DSM 17374]
MVNRKNDEQHEDLQNSPERSTDTRRNSGMYRDFRIAAQARTPLHLFSPVFVYTNDPLEFRRQALDISTRYNQIHKDSGMYLSAARLYMSALINLMYQAVISNYIHEADHDLFSRMVPFLSKNQDGMVVLDFYAEEFPSPQLADMKPPRNFYLEETSRGFFVHQILTDNPALVKAIKPLIAPEGIVFPEATQAMAALIGGISQSSPSVKNRDIDLFTFLTTPARLHPDSLSKQVTYILDAWKDLLPEELRTLGLRGLDYIHEEEHPHPVGPGQSSVPDYFSPLRHIQGEIEAFSQDRNWMPNVVMIAKSTLVWLDQLSKSYGRPITTLDAIPDQELDLFARRGFTALWLIGLWERSSASRRIKHICGNPEAEASAYSLKNYDIASSIGGWQALENLSGRCRTRGIRLASDMVPNHTGIDSGWVISQPSYFISQDYPPFPSYTYEGEDLSPDPTVEIKIEDHYFDRTDAAVTFRRKDKRTGETQYIFHGNDGTSMPWNDTAQIDFLNPEAREAVIQQIMHVARSFPIIRFDAAMTLARKHIQRLWYPVPGHGGDIAGRADHAMDQQAFDSAMPQEFWREVVDRMAVELPDTLLLAEAFWMMEGYFVRTLGMHRVYNSAFMNMLKNENNKQYKDTIKNTILFDPEILKRYVNFMNNPDEDTAIAQFGDGDKYLGVCTLLATMPGLPMIGHGQIEGYREKYGMEFRRAYWDERPDMNLIAAHEKRIFPLLKMRRYFSGVERFQIFDMMDNGSVQESVFAYVNGDHSAMTLVVYNNQYQGVSGIISKASPRLYKYGDGSRQTASTTLADALGLTMGGRHFLLYRNFQDGLTYMVPSLRVFDEGMWFSLSGYQAVILLDLREVEDTDGAYEKLHDMLGGRGTEDIDKELAFLRLAPVYKTMEPLRDRKVMDALSDLSKGMLKKKEERALLLYLGEAYARITAVEESLSPAARSVLPTRPHDVSAQSVLSFIQDLSAFFASPKISVFASGGTIREEYPLVMATALFLLPFISPDIPVDTAMEYADRLMLDRFFRSALPASGIDADTVRRLCHEGALFASVRSGTSWLYPAGYSASSVLMTLLESSSFRNLVGCNDYQGVSWYRKEFFQDALFTVIVATAHALEEKDGPDAEVLLADLLEKERHAGYQVAGLFS